MDVPVVVAADGRLVKVELPTELYRVAYLEGFGWPRCERQELKYRNFADVRALGHLLREIERLPTHHQLLGLWRTETTWSPIAAGPYKQENHAYADDDPTD
jgi:hypothetical protein